MEGESHVDSGAEPIHDGAPHRKAAGAALLVGALGVVYGDIGTSPLYAMSEIFFGNRGIRVTDAHALGAVSLVFWALTLVVLAKYISLVLRADNEGEGGIFAMLGLLRREAATRSRGVPGWTVLGVLAGASLLYGDGMITPAISVLSAVEGLAVVSPAAHPFIVPVTLACLIGLFAIQKRGTHRIGWLFGPIMVVWFVVLALLGVWNILREPAVLRAINPLYAIALVRDQGFNALHILGSVVLCVTGVEAMYADMGHFGRPAIVRTWLGLVYPCLLLNYFGQAAVLTGGGEVANGSLFYALSPDWARVPLIGLATAAAIIASQAMISGAFSLTQQAMSMGLFPRLKVVHTNPHVPGQIYLPFINFVLFAGCTVLVLTFRASTDLAAAYGLAATGTMMVTSITFAQVARRVWGWKFGLLVPVAALLLTADGAMLAATLLKLPDGGYVPLMIGCAVFVIMDTWQWGRVWIGLAYQRRAASYRLTVADLIENRAQSVDPAASRSVVVMASRPIEKPDDVVPPVLAVHFRNWNRLPKHLMFFSVVFVGTPTVAKDQRFRVTTFCQGDTGTVMSVVAQYGYMEQPNVRRALAFLKKRNRLRIPEEPRKWLILIGSERFVTPGRNLFERLRIGLFSRMNRLAKPITDYFGLESDAGLTIETINV